MKFQIIPVTPFQQNCTLMWDENTNKAAVVDPGGDIERISDAIKQHNLTLEKVLVTHGHLDHCGGARKLADLYNVPIEGPNKADDWLLEQLGSEQTRMWGLPPGQPFTPDRWLEQGDEVTVGNETLKVFHCPGHSPGHVIFFMLRQKSPSPAMCFSRARSDAPICPKAASRRLKNPSVKTCTNWAMTCSSFRAMDRSRRSVRNGATTRSSGTKINSDNLHQILFGNGSFQKKKSFFNNRQIRKNLHIL